MQRVFAPLLGLFLMVGMPGCNRGHEPMAGAVRVNPVDGAEMIYIPTGEFVMGGEDVPDNPRHIVMLSGFWIYKNLVTVGQYKAFCTATKRLMPPEVGERDYVVDLGQLRHHYAYDNFNPHWSKEDHPIVNITWEDATAYAEWAHTNLPTDEQWEKAARGTDGRIYPWGNDFDSGKLWCSREDFCDAGGTHRVGELGVSPYGCTDMAGNVSQWCQDHFLRGSSWETPATYMQNFECAAHRDQNVGQGSSMIGFRCVSKQ